MGSARRPTARCLVAVDADDHISQLHASVIDTVEAGRLTFGPGGIWNANWAQFQKENPRASKNAIISYGRSLCGGFGLPCKS